MRRRRCAVGESLEPRLALDATVVFNELMYHPASGATEQLEWVELYNQMAVDIDLSKWSLEGGVDFTFPEGTFLGGGEYLVVASNPAAMESIGGFAGAFGPYVGQLSNGGEAIELRDRNDRLMDEIEYGDGDLWPIAPDGSGASLAKINRDAASGPAANWTSSRVVGGTPGELNFAFTPSAMHAGLNISEVAPLAAPTFWVELINTSVAAVPMAGYELRSSDGDVYEIPAQSLAPGERVVFDRVQIGFQPGVGEELFLVGPGGGEVVDAVRIRAAAQARQDGVSSEWLTPTTSTPGAENGFELETDIVINEIMYHAAPQLSVPARPGSYGPTTTLVPLTAEWRYNDSGDDLGAAWRENDYDDSAWESGPGMFYVETAALGGLPKSTPLDHGSMTYYFRTTFELESPDAQALLVQHVIDDGAVFYVNGHRFLAFNLNVPEDQLNYLSAATGDIGDATLISPTDPIPAEFLRAGVNVLAVEAHQRAANSSDIVMGTQILSAELVIPPQPAVPFAESDEEWVELFNRGDETVDLSGWSFADAFQYTIPAGTTIAPGGYLVVARDPVALAAKFPTAPIIGGFTGSLSNSDERIALRDSVGNPADEVHYFDGGRWSEYADGGGVTLELRDPWADNASPEAWTISDETSRTEWRTYSYRGTAQPSSIGPDNQWQELVLGLLDSGEVLLDDIRVVENPSTAPKQLIQNGTFSGGTADKWRILGNHSHSEIVADPDDPSNSVLRFIADGETEHMSNHAETTLKDGNTFVSIVNGREYEISFRARWVAGSPQLNSRLYFNRLPRTTNIDRPDAAGTPGAANSRLEANIGPTFTGFKHGPVVPAANAPVTVTARADDPQGVVNMTLWYSSGGGAWQNVPMVPGTDGNYTGQIPGQSAGRIVQFYVESVDGQGASATFPAAGRDSRALYKVQDNLAATNGLHNLRLIMTSPDSTLMHATTNLMSNDWIGGTVIYNESEVFYDVGIRLKGSEHSRTTSERLGFAVRFNADQAFRGVYGTVAIDRSESTGFGQREMLIHAAMNHAGDLPTKYHDLIKVISPQATHTGAAELQLARYGDEFLESQYENGGDGEIFEYELVYQLNSTNNGTPEGLKVPVPDSVMGTPIRDMGTDPENYRWTYLLKNNRAEDDFSAVMNFAKVYSTGGGGRDPSQTLEDVIDVDQFLRAYALSMLSGAGDSYGGDGSQHNVMFYQRPSDGKFLHMPHDLDAFYLVDRPLVTSSDLQRLLNSPTRNRLYYGHVQDIISTTYNSSYMSYWAASYGQLLPAQPFASHLSFIVQRSNSILNQIKGLVPEVAFNITTPSGAQTAGPTITIAGDGWVNVREIRVAGSDQPLTLTWTDLNSWTAAIPIPFGASTLTLEAYDFRGNLLATDQVQVESTFSNRPLQEFLRISEIHFHPADGPPGTPFEDANFEFIELVNIGPNTLDLRDARFSEGVQFEFTTAAVTSLAPGARVLIVQDLAGFESRYGDSLPVAGVFTGRLDNAGERLRLEDRFGATILDFTYDDAWYPDTDGGGASLTIVDANAATETWGTEQAWRESRDVHGSPGTDDEVEALLGDTNDDGQVNLDDLNNVRNHFGGGAEGDADHDGDTDLDDLNAVRNFFGSGGAPVAVTIPTAKPLDPRRTLGLLEQKPSPLTTPVASKPTSSEEALDELAAVVWRRWQETSSTVDSIFDEQPLAPQRNARRPK
jgi:hypothetical protein